MRALLLLGLILPLAAQQSERFKGLKCHELDAEQVGHCTQDPDPSFKSTVKITRPMCWCPYWDEKAGKVITPPRDKQREQRIKSLATQLKVQQKAQKKAARKKPLP